MLDLILAFISNVNICHLKVLESGAPLSKASSEESLPLSVGSRVSKASSEECLSVGINRGGGKRVQRRNVVISSTSAPLARMESFHECSIDEEVMQHFYI